MPSKVVIDPKTGPAFGLRGRVVTMNQTRNVISDGVVYISGGCIVALQDAELIAPAGFQDKPVLKTSGTIFPGLIELHNHLSYNILPLWQVPKPFGNRNDWAGSKDYDYLVSKPMDVLGARSDLLPAIVRYVECKCLLGGVTTSQGIRLKSSAQIPRYYRGIVRNVEKTGDPVLPEARTHISDVEAKDWKSFKAALGKCLCLLLHLSEGIDPEARMHFESLQSNGEWALASSLAGIHCTALQAQDFEIMAQHGTSMVWSPLSNLLLYGDTARIADARAAGVLIALGSDWSPSGSKNLLGELKAARAYRNTKGIELPDVEIVAMATCNAAAIVKWDKWLGSIENGKLADLLVIARETGDPYATLIEAHEDDVSLVVINGMPRLGSSAFMKKLGVTTGIEKITVHKKQRVLNLVQATADPAMQDMPLAQAKSTLKQTMGDLRQALKPAKPAPVMAHAPGAPPPETWTLALDELHATGINFRLRLPAGPAGAATGFAPPAAAKLPPSPTQIPPSIELDPLTAVDDPNFIPALDREVNLQGALDAFRKELLDTLK